MYMYLVGVNLCGRHVVYVKHSVCMVVCMVVCMPVSSLYCMYRVFILYGTYVHLVCMVYI